MKFWFCLLTIFQNCSYKLYITKTCKYFVNRRKLYNKTICKIYFLTFQILFVKLWWARWNIFSTFSSIVQNFFIFLLQCCNILTEEIVLFWVFLCEQNYILFSHYFGLMFLKWCIVNEWKWFFVFKCNVNFTIKMKHVIFYTININITLASSRFCI